MSIKKIAELAGTSPATVSRVLSTPDHRCQTPGLSESIWRIAKELHYLPNTAAQELRKGSTTCPAPFSVDIFLTRFDSLVKILFSANCMFIFRMNFKKMDTVGRNAQHRGYSSHKCPILLHT